MNAVSSFVHHLCAKNSLRWHPLLSVYYLTYACELRCRHCSDGNGEPYYRQSEKTLPAAKVIGLLRIVIVRRHSDFLVLTGGEPLQYPEFAEVLMGLKELKFRGVILRKTSLYLLRIRTSTTPWRGTVALNSSLYLPRSFWRHRSRTI